MKIHHRAVEFLVSPHDALQPGRDHKILLLQTQHPALVPRIVRVQDFRNRFHRAAVFHRLDIIVGGIRSLVGVHRHYFGAPEPHRVHGVVVIPGHRHIIGNRQNFLIPLVVENPPVIHVLLPNLAAEFHGHGLVRPAELPDIAVLQPGIRQLGLIPVDDLLLEHAVTVTDPAAIARNMQRGHGIQEAGGQPSQPAATESGFRFLLGQILQTDSQVAEAFLAQRQNIQIDQIAQQNPPLQIFDGKIVDLLAVALHILAVRSRPALGDQVADQAGQSLVAFPVGTLFDSFAVNTLEFFQILANEPRFIMKHGNPPPVLVDIRRHIPWQIFSRNNPFS